MYKVNVLTSGKYCNVDTGARYVLGKKQTIKLCKLFLENECEIEIFKFIRCTHTIFCWSEYEAHDVTKKLWG